MPSPVGGLGLAPRKKYQFCAKNYAILSKFWYLFPILQHAKIVTSALEKVGGGLSRPESGGTYPPVPAAPMPMCAITNSQTTRCRRPLLISTFLLLHVGDLSSALERCDWRESRRLE